MAEKVCDCKVLIVSRSCDKCNNGIMYPTEKPTRYYDPKIKKMLGSWESTCKIIFEHKCNNCGEIQYFQIQYPYQRFVPIEPLRDPIGNEVNCQEEFAEPVEFE